MVPNYIYNKYKISKKRQEISERKGAPLWLLVLQPIVKENSVLDVRQKR